MARKKRKGAKRTKRGSTRVIIGPKSLAKAVAGIMKRLKAKQARRLLKKVKKKPRGRR